jgi:hypothetical protein
MAGIQGVRLGVVGSGFEVQLPWWRRVLVLLMMGLMGAATLHAKGDVKSIPSIGTEVVPTPFTW